MLFFIYKQRAESIELCLTAETDPWPWWYAIAARSRYHFTMDFRTNKLTVRHIPW
ncbi:MAG: hypothetical protein SCH71_03345 [Desulfobulbaceae bacterium]|nr:hypothetical protein [Desulfobulbaceae bacterium]